MDQPQQPSTGQALNTATRLSRSDQCRVLYQVRAYGTPWGGGTHRETDLVDRLAAAGYEIVRRRSPDSAAVSVTMTREQWREVEGVIREVWLCEGVEVLANELATLLGQRA